MALRRTVQLSFVALHKRYPPERLSQSRPLIALKTIHTRAELPFDAFAYVPPLSSSLRWWKHVGSEGSSSVSFQLPQAHACSNILE